MQKPRQKTVIENRPIASSILETPSKDPSFAPPLQIAVKADIIIRGREKIVRYVDNRTNTVEEAALKDFQVKNHP